MAESTRSKVVVLSLHPTHAYAILEGRKTVEFRRSRIPADAQSVVIYATSPIMKVLGSATVAGFQEAAPATIWRNYRKQGNVSKAFFDAYFDGASQARCYVLESPKRFDEDLSLDAFGVSTPPQSFAYAKTPLGFHVVLSSHGDEVSRKSGESATITALSRQFTTSECRGSC